MSGLQLIQRLTVLRRTIRRRLFVYGVVSVLAGGVGAFLAIVGIDWLLWLPPLPRLVVGGLFLTGFVVATLHWIVRPLNANIGNVEVAARLESHFGSLDDRLVSTVNFLERGDAGSEPMMRRVVSTTEEVITHIPLESALSLRPLALRAALMAACLAAFTVIGLASPGWISTGMYRYVHPWGEFEWPRAVSIRPLTDDKVVALGESVIVRMKVERGLHDTLRGVVYVREPGGRATALAMVREADGSFRATIDSITKTTQYWFEAGDDNTERHPYSINVVRRPEVVEALATIEPPSYAASQSPRVRDLADGQVEAPVGGTVQVAIRASKPIPAGRGVGLRTTDGTLIPLILDPAEATWLSARFEVERDLRFRIELRDEYGFENRGAVEHTILAVADMPPRVTLLEPASLVELTPEGSVLLVVRVEDDFGIAGLELESEVLGHIDSVTTPLTERMEFIDTNAGVAAAARFVWTVRDRLPEELLAGDVLVYDVVARDNRPTPEGTGQLGRSATMRIKIISALEFDIRMRSDLVRLEARIREAALAQGDLLDRTLALVRGDDEPGSLTEADRDIAASLAGEQARLIKRVGDVAGRFDKLAVRMEQNRAGTDQTRARMRASGNALRRAAAEPMTDAATALSEVRREDAEREQQARLQEAVQSEAESADRLNALLEEMSQWGSFQEVFAKTRDLFDRQTILRMQTAKLGKAMLGKPVESLNANEAAELNRTRRQQEQLETDVHRLLERMARLVAGAGDRDRASADAMDAALRSARANDMARQLRSAAEALKTNRTAAAGMAQKAAADAMQKMIAALRERDSRQLAELRKRLDEAREQVAYLIERQEAIRAATNEASLMGEDESGFETLADEQHVLRRNTRLLGDELVGSPKTAPAARLVLEAVNTMDRATRYLRGKAPSEAVDGQDKTLVLLRAAEEALDEMERDAAEELLRRSLAQIREDLNQLLAAQRLVHGGITQLVEGIVEPGRIKRKEARAAAKLARAQSELRATVEDQLPHFEKVPVYKWALERITRWMDETRTRLNARRLDEELVVTSGRIIKELEGLVAAIVATEALPIDTQFVESDKGGGGGAANSQSRPVPPVAELFVLKAMQTDINERTTQLGGPLDPNEVTGQALRRLRMLGEDQAHVRKLTELVTREVEQP